MSELADGQTDEAEAVEKKPEVVTITGDQTEFYTRFKDQILSANRREGEERLLVAVPQILQGMDDVKGNMRVSLAQHFAPEGLDLPHEAVWVKDASEREQMQIDVVLKGKALRQFDLMRDADAREQVVHREAMMAR